MQSVTAKDGLVDEAMCAETMSWSDTSEGSAERDIVGDEVVRLTLREAAEAFLMEIGALIIYSKLTSANAMIEKGEGIAEFFCSPFSFCHAFRTKCLEDFCELLCHLQW